MPFLQNSGAISLNNIKTLFGGPVSPSIANYYRGGSYIPANKTVNYTERQPSSGEYYDGAHTWRFDQNGNNTLIQWAGSLVYNQYGTVSTLTSVTLGSFTYYRGSYRQTTASAVKGFVQFYYGVYRTYPSSYQQAINTNIPSSGTISLSQFYGAEKP